METPFRFASDNHPTLLKKIPVNVRTSDATVWREADTDELSETTRIVIPLCLRVTECLKDRIGLQDLPLEKAETAFGCETKP